MENNKRFSALKKGGTLCFWQVLVEKTINKFQKFYPSVFLSAYSMIYWILIIALLVDERTVYSDLQILPREQLGLIELRAMYVGLLTAIALFSSLAALYRELRLAGVLFALISNLALAAARGYGMFGETHASALMTELLFAELIAALLALVAFFCMILPARELRTNLRIGKWKLDLHSNEGWILSFTLRFGQFGAAFNHE